MKLMLTTAVVGIGAIPQAALAPAAAQNKTARLAASRSFDIPAQPLDAALNHFGRQSGLQVTLAAATAEGVTSSAVSGTYTPQEALARLLAGTGIDHRVTHDGTAVVGSASAAAGATALADGSTPLETIQVDGEAGRGGVAEINIDTADLERKNPTDIADVFREEPGIKVGSSVPMSQKVYVHGIEETNLAVTVDGSRQNNKVFHHNATNLIDPGLLKAVGVDAGVAPADAGPGALAGSINYETKDARDMLDGDGFGGFVNSSYNFNSDTFTTGLAGYGMKDGFEFLGYLNFGKGDSFTAGNGDVVRGTSTDILSGIGKLAYEFDSGDRIEISHEMVRDEAPRPFRANIGFIEGRPNWEPRIRDYRLERQNTVITYTDETPEGWWDPTAMLAYSRSAVDTTVYLRPGSVPPTYPITGTTESLNGKFENKFAFDIGNIVAGVDFYNDEASLDDPFDAASEKIRNIGAYAQARLEPFDRTRLSFGGRADNQWFTGTGGQEWDNAGLSGNVSGEYDLIENLLTAKAGYSHVWAGIPLAENFIMNPNWTYNFRPKPVTADNYTAGLVARYEGFTVEGSVFRSDIDNARKPAYDVGRASYFRDVSSEGFELGIGYEWVNSYIKVKYASIDVSIDGQPADSDTGNYLATPVGDIITISAGHTFEDWGVTIGGDVEIAPEYDNVAPGSKPYKAYEVANAFVEYRPPSHQNLTLRAEVNNIFDETYADRATYGQEFGTVTPLYQPGRSFIVSVKATF